MALRSRLNALDIRFSGRLARLADGRAGLRQAAIILAHSGDSPFWVGGVLIVLLWPGLPAWKPAALLDLGGMLLTAVLVQIIKWSVRRPRAAGEWGQGYRRLDPHSFPSGHAARAVCLSILALVTGPPAWAALLTLWAPLVGLARVSLRVHYLSDVAAGAVCGLACGLILAATAPLAGRALL